MNIIETKEVPREAMCLSAGPVQLVASDDKGQKIPVSLLARTAEPIHHWYWGKVVHDMEGLALHKDKIAIDYCHDDDDILGYIDGFDADAAKGLTLTGSLVPYRDEDRVDEIRHKSAQGVPYESSIFFDDAKVEHIWEDEVATVNGREIEGPATIVRSWSLRGVAICPYGADKNTNATFKKDGDTVAVDILTHRGSPVAEKSSAAGRLPQQHDRDEALRFRKVLGDRGAVLFADGVSFEDAVRTVVGDLDRKAKELEAKLAVAKRCNATPKQTQALSRPAAQKPKRPSTTRQLDTPGFTAMMASFGR